MRLEAEPRAVVAAHHRGVVDAAAGARAAAWRGEGASAVAGSVRPVGPRREVGDEGAKEEEELETVRSWILARRERARWANRVGIPVERARISKRP